MNLHYMLQKGSPHISVQAGAQMAHGRITGDHWRGISFQSGATLDVKHVRRFYSMRAQPDTCGWRVIVPKGMRFELEFREADTARRLSGWQQEATAGDAVVRLVWPKVDAMDCDLHLSARGKTENGTVFLGVHRALSRDWLYQAAKGKGVEIGPGPVPQILPGPDVDITYVEQMHPEEWNRLYNTRGTFPVRPELWSNYVIGHAADLPVEDGSLDFIFGSHVFEHLTNPYGHLQRWRRKLKPSGKILCIIPDLMSTKDAFQRPTRHDEWLAEYAGECWEPTKDHYARALAQPADSLNVNEAMRERFSIHTHFYTNTNTQELMEFACAHLGYRSYDIEWTPNHKDLHFMLRAGDLQDPWRYSGG